MKNLYLLLFKTQSSFSERYFKCIVSLLGLFFSINLSAQKTPAVTQVYARDFINNIVDVGLSDFGLITAEDSVNIYFVAVRHSVAEKNAPSEVIAKSIKQVKFYNSAYRAKATKIYESRVGNYTIVLYQSPKPPMRKWQASYYYSLNYKKGKFSTFRDKWVSDNIWAMHSAKIEVGKQPKTGPFTIKVPFDAGIAKGMPLVNSDGFIAGMFAESSLGKKSVRAVSMDDIAKALYAAGDSSCKYFNMVEWGNTATRCVLEEEARRAAAEKERLAAETKDKLSSEEKAKLEAKQKAEAEKDSAKAIAKANRKEHKKHLIELGIHGSFLAGPLQVPGVVKDNYFKTRVFDAGLSLHINLGRSGANRFTLKPRYGNFYERNDPGLWTSPDDEMKIVISTYKYAELPLVFERQLYRSKNYSISIGAGYSAGMVFDQQYTWIDKTATIDNVVPISSSKYPVMQRLLGELHFYESKLFRMGAIYMTDISDYPNVNYVVQHNGTDYTPFAGRNRAWYVGLEMEIKLTGHRSAR